MKEIKEAIEYLTELLDDIKQHYDKKEEAICFYKLYLINRYTDMVLEGKKAKRMAIL